MADKFTCPHICPGADSSTPAPKEFERPVKDPNAVYTSMTTYIPGLIQPPEKKSYPPGAPPIYLPQPTDSTSGDILDMGPIGPWAPGHMDWTPQAGMTGIRPVVDTYSITHYSTGEWRKNNKYTLTPRATDKAKSLDESIRSALNDAFKNMDGKQAESNEQLKNRAKTLAYWKKQALKAVNGITKEINTLDKDRAKLKSACRILMMPERIARECLELRTNRYEPDLVRDDAEQELIKEMAMVGEVRKLFQDTLAKVETQMASNKAAKASIETDWSDKMVALKLDGQNLSMGDDSTLILRHPGVARWTENSTSLEYWIHFCQESVRNCEEVRQNSENLRGRLMEAITKGSQDIKIQGERTNAALAETVKATQQMCAALENNLRDNLQTTADVEKLMDYLTDSLRKVDHRNKLVMTRLHNRNYNRPNVENCRDEAQYALMAEAKLVKETAESLTDKMRQAQAVRSELMKYRGDLEKDIACKRKSLLIDEDRIARARAHMPTPEEFANA